jgi:ribosomal protein L7/L12
MPDSNTDICPLCGANVVHVIPRVTTVEDIVHFQQTAPRFSGLTEHELDFGWLHPGIYCTSCDYVVLVEYPIPDAVCAIDERSVALVLLDPGPNRLKVMSILRTELGLSPAEARELIGKPPVTILHVLRESQERVETLCEILAEVGASAAVERRDS